MRVQARPRSWQEARQRRPPGGKEGQAQHGHGQREGQTWDGDGGPASVDIRLDRAGGLDVPEVRKHAAQKGAGPEVSEVRIFRGGRVTPRGRLLSLERHVR